MGSADFGGCALPAAAPPRRVEPGAAGTAAAVPPLGGGAVRDGGCGRHAVRRNDPGGLVRRPRTRSVCRDVADDDGAGADARAHRGRRHGPVAGGARRGTAADAERAGRAARLRGAAGAPLGRVRPGSERSHGQRVRRMARTDRDVPAHQVCAALHAVGSRSGLSSRYEWTHPDCEVAPPPDVRRGLSVDARPASGFSSSWRCPRCETCRPRRATTCGRCSGWVMPPCSSCRIVSADRGLGALAFGSAEERPWPDELVMRLRLVAEVFANALARKQTEDALRASESMKSSILHSLRSGVAVVDSRRPRAGPQRELDAAGRARAAIRSSRSVKTFFSRRPRPARRTTPRCDELGAGVQSVLQGVRDSFSYEYTTQLGQSPAGGPSWSIRSIGPTAARS